MRRECVVLGAVLSVGMVLTAAAQGPAVEPLPPAPPQPPCDINYRDHGPVRTAQVHRRLEVPARQGIEQFVEYVGRKTRMYRVVITDVDVAAGRVRMTGIADAGAPPLPEGGVVLELRIEPTDTGDRVTLTLVLDHGVTDHRVLHDGMLCGLAEVAALP